MGDKDGISHIKLQRLNNIHYRINFQVMHPLNVSSLAMLIEAKLLDRKINDRQGFTLEIEIRYDFQRKSFLFYEFMTRSSFNSVLLFVIKECGQNLYGYTGYLSSSEICSHESLEVLCIDLTHNEGQFSYFNVSTELACCAILDSRNLKKLHLTDCSFTRESTKLLGQILNGSQHRIVELLLSDISSERDFYLELGNILAKNTTVKKLSLPNKPPYFHWFNSFVIFLTIYPVLVHNQTITWLECEYESDVEGYQEQYGNALSRNSTITELFFRFKDKSLIDIVLPDITHNYSLLNFGEKRNNSDEVFLNTHPSVKIITNRNWKGREKCRNAAIYTLFALKPILGKDVARLIAKMVFQSRGTGVWCVVEKEKEEKSDKRSLFERWLGWLI